MFAELRKYQRLYHPQASLFYYRDQQNREVDFVWSSAGHLVLMEAKWTEHIHRTDASVMDAVAQVFAASPSQPYRTQAMQLICRTPDDFSLATNARVVNGFRLREVITAL